MTTRTFKQQGFGYGAEPLTIVAKINGVVAYEGPVTTVDEPLPNGPNGPKSPEDLEKSVDLFSWTNTVDFEGSAEVEIAVSGTGTLVTTVTQANYSPKTVKNAEDDDVTVSSGPTEYLGFGGTDPVENPKIDGIEVERVRDLDPDDVLTGQWYYVIDGGSTFTGTLQVQKGIEPTE